MNLKKSYPSIYQILGDFGFKTIEQKTAIKNLLKASSILGKEESLINKLPPRSDFNDFVFDLLSFVKETQEKFVIRKANQERWEVNGSEWMNKVSIDNLHLQVIEEIKPNTRRADILCILGSTMPNMLKRLNYARLLIEKGLEIKEVILLSGERYANPKVDDKIEEVANYLNIDEINQVTEAHLIKYIFEKSSLNGSYAVTLINTPRNNLPRPTTQTTMIDFVKWYKDQNRTDKDVIFISSQPNIKYQEAIISQILRYSEIQVNFEVVGPAFNENKAHVWIAGLGSYIFAHTPNILIEYKEVITDSKVINLFEELYYSQPLIYSDAVINHLIGQNIESADLVLGTAER